MRSFNAIRDLDAAMIGAFADTDLMGDTGTYTDATQAAVPVTLMIDRAVQRLGEYGQIVGTDTQIGLQLRQVSPSQKGKVTVQTLDIAGVVLSSKTFTLGRRVEGDPSVEWWSVTQ